jgi:hypothetical protein
MEFRSDIENLYERDSNTGGSIGIFYDIWLYTIYYN